MTKEQIIGIIVAILVIVAVLVVTKKVLKLVLVVAVIVCLLVYLGKISPQQLQSIGECVTSSQENIEKISTLAKESKNIQDTTAKDGSIKDVRINVGGQWFSVSDIDKLVCVEGDESTIIVNGQSYTIDDKNIAELLKVFRK